MSLLSVTDVANFCDLSEATIYRLIAEEKLPAFKLGRALRVDADALRAWLETRRVTKPDYPVPELAPPEPVKRSKFRPRVIKGGEQ